MPVLLIVTFRIYFKISVHYIYILGFFSPATLNHMDTYRRVEGVEALHTDKR